MPYPAAAALVGSGIQAAFRHWRAGVVTAAAALAMIAAIVPRVLPEDQPAAEGAERTIPRSPFSPAAPITVTEPEAALAETERFPKRAAERSEPDGFDRAAVPVLQRRLDLIAAHGPRRPETAAVTGPHGWTHGDCQNWNLIWSDDRIVAVIDWDRLRFRPYAEELVQAATWQFYEPDGRIDLAKVAALLSGYRVDRSCDDLFFSEERMITWWTANLEAVEATFSA